MRVSRVCSLPVIWLAVLFAAPLRGQQQANWGTQADSLRGQNGSRFTFVCPAGGTLSGRLWGTELYTDDSSICTAAVHAGLITVQSGGTVSIEIRAGASAYTGTTRNGVTSQGYGAYGGSFVFVSGSSGNPVVTAATWTTQADGWRGRNGQRFSISCPGGGELAARLWGTDLYTDDSSICTAAVHAGLISREAGGTVRIEIRPGAGAYQASTRNGLTSREYGAFSGSFVFVGRPPAGDVLVYRVTNYWKEKSFGHVYHIDFANCSVREPGAGMDLELTGQSFSVCQKGTRVIFTIKHRNGYVIEYDWVLTDAGRTVRGAYKDSAGGWGPSIGVLER